MLFLWSMLLANKAFMSLQLADVHSSLVDSRIGVVVFGFEDDLFISGIGRQDEVPFIRMAPLFCTSIESL